MGRIAKPSDSKDTYTSQSKKNMKLLLALAASAYAISEVEFKKLEDWAREAGLKIQKDTADDNCAWTTGDFGAAMLCPDNFATYGLCASGGNYDCGSGEEGEGWRLHCCDFGATAAPSQCRVQSSREFGEELNCDGGNNLMNGACTSGRIQDCNGKRATHELICCDYDGLEATGSVYTVQGSWGQDIDCPAGYLVTGYCSSGGKGNECMLNGKATSHYINCEKYDNNN